MTKETLLAHIHSRIDCLDNHGAGPASGRGWLSNPGEPVDLAAFGVGQEPRHFDFAIWCQTPNPAFEGRTPQQVIDNGTGTERDHLAHAVDAIAALLDGAFS